MYRVGEAVANQSWPGRWRGGNGGGAWTRHREALMPDSPHEAGGDSLGHPGSDLSSDLAVGPAAVA